VFARLELALADWPAENRRRWAVHLFVWSIAAGIVNTVLYLLGRISLELMVLVTLDLSWLAVTFTALDIVFTTDVRVQQDDEGTPSNGRS
jgi:hypothetical protein